VKAVWILLAVLLTCLAIGGLISAGHDTDAPSLIFDLGTSGLLGWVAIGLWRKARR
jgi:hypothetical protein